MREVREMRERRETRRDERRGDGKKMKKDVGEGKGTLGKGGGEMGILKKIYYICLFETKTTSRPTLCVEPPPY